MAARVSVGATVNEAFNFGLKRMGAVFKAFFLPILIGMLILGAVAMSLVDVTKAQGMHPHSLDDVASLLRVPLPVAVGAFFLGMLPMMVLVSGGSATIYRLVALGEERKGFLQLRLDGPAWRVFFAVLIQTLINYGVFIVAGLIAWAVTKQNPLDGLKAYFDFVMSVAAQGPSAQPSPEEIQAMIPKLGGLAYTGLIAVIPSLYLGVKLAPFPAASAAENRLALFKTFRMTFGAWWSMLWCWLLFIVAFLLVGIVVGLGESVLTLVQKFLETQGGAMAVFGVVIAIALAAFRIVFQLFTLGVQLALPASMYRRIERGE